jgi:hypothetical protein
MRTRTVPVFPSRMIVPTRVGRWQAGQTTITFEIWIGPAFSITPPGWICGDHVQVLDEDAALLRARLENTTLLAAVLAAQHLDEIALLDLHGLGHQRSPFVGLVLSSREKPLWQGRRERS